MIPATAPNNSGEGWPASISSSVPPCSVVFGARCSIRVTWSIPAEPFRDALSRLKVPGTFVSAPGLGTLWRSFLPRRRNPRGCPATRLGSLASPDRGAYKMNSTERLPVVSGTPGIPVGQGGLPACPKDRQRAATRAYRWPSPFAANAAAKKTTTTRTQATTKA